MLIKFGLDADNLLHMALVPDGYSDIFDASMLSSIYTKDEIRSLSFVCYCTIPSILFINSNSPSMRVAFDCCQLFVINFEWAYDYQYCYSVSSWSITKNVAAQLLFLIADKDGICHPITCALFLPNMSQPSVQFFSYSSQAPIVVVGKTIYMIFPRRKGAILYVQKMRSERSLKRLATKFMFLAPIQLMKLKKKMYTATYKTTLSWMRRELFGKKAI